MKSGITFCATIIILLHSIGYAQQRPSDSDRPCTEGQRRQFDFWVGSWDLSWPSGPARPAGFGRNNVQKIFANCVVQENFSSDAPTQFRGMSLSSYVPELGKWKQVWADNQGGYLDFIGESKNGEMVFTREKEMNGKKILQRMVWKNIKPMELDWSWEKSEDGGQTWQVLWPIHYTRRRQ